MSSDIALSPRACCVFVPGAIQQFIRQVQDLRRNFLPLFFQYPVIEGKCQRHQHHARNTHKDAQEHKKPSVVDMTYEQYRDWLLTATDARSRYLAGELTEEEAMAIIYVPRKDELTGDNSSELTLETAAT